MIECKHPHSPKAAQCRSCFVRPPIDRFFPRIQVSDEDGCWNWQGATDNGYGFLQFGSTRKALAHRLSYWLLRGPIPTDLQIDHLCRNRRCVNPGHMELVSIKENVLRGVGPSAANATKTHCCKGHPFEGDNLYVKPNGERVCRTCKNATQRARRAIY